MSAYETQTEDGTTIAQFDCPIDGKDSLDENPKAFRLVRCIDGEVLAHRSDEEGLDSYTYRYSRRPAASAPCRRLTPPPHLLRRRQRDVGR